MKLQKLSFKKRLITGFGIILVLSAAIIAFSVYSIGEMAKFPDMIYKHPLKVSISVRDIDINIHAIHRSMDNLFLVNDVKQINEIVKNVEKNDSLILKEFKVINERFMGDKEIIKQANIAFHKWMAVRYNVINLVKNGENLSLIKKERVKEIQYVDILFSKTQELIDFTQKNASSFHDKMENKVKRILMILISTTLCLFFISLFISLLISKSISKSIGTFVTKINTLYESKKEIIGASKLIENEPKLFDKVHTNLLLSYNKLNEEILERKSIEQELLKSKAEIEKNEQLLKDALNIANMGHWQLDIKNNQLYWSDETYKIFELAPNQFEPNYEAFLELIHPEDREKVNTSYHNSIKNKTEYSIQHRILSKGSIKYVFEKGRTTYDENGTPISTIGIIQDITNQKLNELNLIESKNKIEASEVRFRRILNSFFDGVYVCSPSYEIEYLNDAMQKRIGSNTLGKKCYKVIYNLNQKCKWCVYPRLSSKDIISYKIKDPNNNKYYHVKNMKLQSGSKLTLFEDISTQEKSEKEIQKLIAAVENSPHMIIITDPNGIIEYVNKKYLEVMGVSKADAIGNYPNIFKPDYYSKTFYIKLRVHILSNKTWQGELQDKNAYGETFWISVKITPMLNANNKITNLVIIKEDITEKKEIEKRMLNAIIEAEEAERKRMAANLHDDLGPYLSGIKLYVTKLKKKEISHKDQLSFAKNLDEMIDESISITRNVANLMTPNTLLDFGYINALESFIKKINSTEKIIIEFKKPKSIFSENAIKEVIIYRIIIELINNSIKHANADKIKISIKYGQDILINYKDDGTGFNLKEDILRTGNGLTNIFNRLKSINGTYQFKSVPGKGIIFSFKIPL